ncbi:unnamed protein product [Brassicogethes aeneus]|uniref:Protein SMG9 n=1 Tax=Brassicogethes aeneus TaxID=1431903 RepID=A0A9P0BF70_BRAAE|nr:unnamed protein product [Brassicogethes aeneus]
MSERGKFYNKKKSGWLTSRDQSFGRVFSSKSDSFTTLKNEKLSKEGTSSGSVPKVKQPTILLKAREQNEEVSESPKRTKSENENSNISIIPSAAKETEGQHSQKTKHMKKSEKFLDDGILFNESIQEFLKDNYDFLVVGVVGGHGVGKSTIMNLLAEKNITDEIKKSVFKQAPETDEFGEFTKNEDCSKYGEIFKIQGVHHLETNSNATHGIDLYVSSNRIIYLDCQPFNSISVLEDLVKHESKRTNLVSEFIPVENSGEIQSLQITAFLMSVCHVLILVQDWFLDSNVIRFLQTAEMLKPTMSNPEDELLDHFPNLLLVHNKAQLDDFSPCKFKKMQSIYRELFEKSKMHIETHMGMGSGHVINYLNPSSCGNPINLFLIPEIDPYSDIIYNGHPPLETLFKKLKGGILATTRIPITHVSFSEKTWLIYCVKVWETVKKSSFFVEYTKLMP